MQNNKKLSDERMGNISRLLSTIEFTYIAFLDPNDPCDQDDWEEIAQENNIPLEELKQFSRQWAEWMKT